MSEGLVRMLPGVAATLSAMLGMLALLPRSRSRRRILFGLMNLGTYFWSVSYFLGLGARGWFGPADTVIVGRALFALGQVGVALAVTTWLLFAVDVTGLRAWTRGWRSVATYVPGALLVIVMFSNPVHGLFVTWGGTAPVADFTYGPLGSVLNVAMYALVMLSSFVYTRAVLREPAGPRRSLFSVLAIAALIPLIGNAVWMSRSITGLVLPFNPTVVLFTLLDLLLAVAVFRVGLLDIVPVAEGHAFRSMRDGGVVIGAEGRIVVFNDSFHAVFPGAKTGECLSDVAPSFWAYLARRDEASEADTPCLFDLDAHLYQVTVAHMASRSGASLGDSIVLRDVTQEQAAQQRIVDLNMKLERTVLELEDATNLKDRFISDMSHELRTPLQSIIGFAGSLARELSGGLNAEQHEQVQIVLDSGRHLASVIESLLDLSSAESGFMVMHTNKFDVNDVARHVMETMRPIAAQKDIELRVEACCAGVCVVHSDETKLRQVLLNLLGNAVKFTQSGHVTLKVGCDNGEVLLHVADTGPGIRPEDLPHVFDAFYQGAAGSAPSVRGAGLGLCVSQSLVQVLGGRISLESVVGEGTTFCVTIPMEPPAAETRGAACA